MELKAFKGMPHEFGGIDYTEGSEVEGGEFAVQIGKSGNEYIFDKNSSEGERLSKEYKKLDKNGRLTEDDPLALEAFDQIAREEALRHAQRSVNEKGIDPFRNMYEQGGQAANGGVKYATGGPMMNPAEVPNVNPGAQYNTSMSYAPKTMEEYQREQTGADRMRSSFGSWDLRNAPTAKAFKEIDKGREFGMLMGDLVLSPVTTAVTKKSFSEMAMGDMGYTSSDATKRAVGDDTMTGTAFGYGFAESEGVISNLGTEFFNTTSKDGGALPQKKYAAGGASGWLQGFETIHNLRQLSKQMAGPAIDSKIADKMGEEYVRQPIAGQPTTTSGTSLNIPINKKQTEEQGLDPRYIDPQGNNWMMDPNQTYAMPPASDTTSMVGTDVPINLGIGNTGGSFGSFGGFKNGGAKPIYGYYADGGGKKEENEVTGVAVTPTGAAYSSDLMSLDNRGVGSTDYGMIPANLEQYARAFFGASEPFTEKDISQQEANALLEVLKKRKEPNTIGYSDFDTVKSQDVYQASIMDLLSNDQNIMRSLLGKAAVKETPDYYEVTSDYDFAKGKSLSDINNTMDLLGYLHNISPFVNRDAVSKKDAINLRIPKN